MMLKSFPSHISKTKHVKYNVDKVITQTKQSYCFETTINTQNITKYRTYDLYRKFLLAGKNYPGGYEEVKTKAKKQILALKDLNNEEELQKAFERGEYVLKEIEGFNSFHKYRKLRKRYYCPDYEKEFTQSFLQLSSSFDK